MSPIVLSLLGGCFELPFDGPVHGDPGQSWTITITLAAEVADGWTEAEPGQLFVGGGEAASTSEALLCGGDLDPIVVAAGGIGCADERPIEAWVEPALVLVDRFDEAVACGVATHPLDPLADPIVRPDDAPFAVGVLFEGNHECTGGEDEITLEIEP